ncbi:hypothetical protein [Kineosporia sp. NBRC 101731]|uniref:TolB family protein n=1 Tax=Kineosporia sp. NBRC 101731 TaxID=3032199 RepID=UPI0024A3476F|nr:hypothetical protein [Kineosporia sp. NBRC 101731]GLY30836.1 hypothetical protein Kisp02_42010 [Kineosporia sp. NBRC 101731]
MSVRRSFRLIQVLAVSTVVGMGILGTPPSASAGDRTTARTACPPGWLGTTTNAEPQISADGRYVVFTGYAPDTESGDRMIFLRDLLLRRTTVASDPVKGGYNFLPSISADGTRVSYLNLGSDSPVNEAGIWVYDRRTGERTREGGGHVWTSPMLDAHGRHLTYNHLENNDSDLASVFVRDVDSDRVTLVSANLEGKTANDTSIEPEISANGRLVLFKSSATDLTENASTASVQGALYVRDLRTNKTTLIPDRFGKPASVFRFNQRLSPDGRFVLYTDTDGVWRYDRQTRRTAAAAVPRRIEFDSSADIGQGGRLVLLQTPGSLVLRNVGTGKENGVDARPDGSFDLGQPGYPGAMTPDGRYVVYYTSGTDRDRAEKAEGMVNVYRRDLRTRTTRLVSTSDAGGACA